MAIKDCIMIITFYICKCLKIKEILNEQELFITAVKYVKIITFCQCHWWQHSGRTLASSSQGGGLNPYLASRERK
jgi:hypothetical protein